MFYKIKGDGRMSYKALVEVVDKGLVEVNVFCDEELLLTKHYTTSEEAIYRLRFMKEITKNLDVAIFIDEKGNKFNLLHD